MVTQIIGLVSVFLVLGLIFTNRSLLAILLVVFVSSIALFFIRISLEKMPLLDAFFDSFGFLSNIVLVFLVVHFFKKRSAHDKSL
ncbi:hypothetical protein A3783_10435 [Exiguobacterium undae]|uniref:Uncharacterized protein n=1 Tax=Exiguobacterium undae TaxID=169177 RepID=A0ABX2V781_9BACL|nr:hypothetical protein A3783_10435 [Exiguobacterium undae]